MVAFVSFFLFSTDYGPVSVTLNLVGHSDSLTYQTHIHCWPPESCPALGMVYVPMNQELRPLLQHGLCYGKYVAHTYAKGSGRGKGVCAHECVCVQSVLITGKYHIGPGEEEGVCVHMNVRVFNQFSLLGNPILVLGEGRGGCVCVQSSVLITGKSCISLFTKMNPRSQGSLLHHLKHGVAQL